MIYKYLPYFIFKPLFGDRNKWGSKTDFNDREFIEWQDNCYLKFYKYRIYKETLWSIANGFKFVMVFYLYK